MIKRCYDCSGQCHGHNFPLVVEGRGWSEYIIAAATTTTTTTTTTTNRY